MTNLGVKTAPNDAIKPAVAIELPNGSTEKIVVGDANVTVRDLKVDCELQFGIPCNLQKVSALENPDKEFNDWSPLKDSGQTFSDQVIVLQVPVWWNKFICVSLNNEIDNVCRRAKLPMQQISREERVFVGYFIACCRGHENALQRLKALDIQIDQYAVTDAGRNLFHAAAAGGKVSCVDFVAKHLIEPSKEVLSALDTNRETPIDIARRLNYHDTERLLHKYMYSDRRDAEKRTSTESGIEDCDSVCSDDSTEDRKTENANTTLENTRNDCQCNIEEIKNTIFEELVVTECDDGLSFATNMKLGQQNTPPKQRLTSEISMTQFSKRHRQEREASPCSSDSSDESSSISPRLARPQTLNLASQNQPLLQRRVVRPKSARSKCYPPQMNTVNQEDGCDENNNHLPPLESQNLVKQTGRNDPDPMRRLKQTIVQTNGNPKPASAMVNRLIPSPDRLSPSPDEERLVTKSAPGSPRILRRLVFKPSVRPPATGNTVCPLSPKISSRILDQRRGSEPVPCLTRPVGLGMGRTRRDAVINDLQHGENHVTSPILHKRGKARSICEVNLLESLRGKKDMDEEERMDRPWNAWISVRRESVQLRNPAENNSQSVLNSKRKSYQQWLSEKELDHLQKLFAKAQENAKTNENHGAKLQKGKTFDEWLEDKRREIESEKEREKGLEENQKIEEDKKHQRRRMSKAKYDKWLMQKEWGALQIEEKMEQEAKQKHELMKKKWEEEDEKKRKNELLLGRTQSLPLEGAAPRITGITRSRHSIK